jgi:hypothetical protein
VVRVTFIQVKLTKIFYIITLFKLPFSYVCFIMYIVLLSILQSVHLLYKSCNVKKVGKLVRFKQKGQKQASFLAFHKCCQGCLLRGPRVVRYKIHLYSLQNRPEKLAILPVSKARTNKFYIYQRCTYMVYIFDY